MFGFMLGSFLTKIYVDIGFVDLGTVVIGVRFYTTTISPVISEQVKKVKQIKQRKKQFSL